MRKAQAGLKQSQGLTLRGARGDDAGEVAKRRMRSEIQEPAKKVRENKSVCVKEKDSSHQRDGHRFCEWCKAAEEEELFIISEALKKCLLFLKPELFRIKAMPTILYSMHPKCCAPWPHA